MKPKTHDLEEALRGLDYPAPRSKLVSLAVSNGAAPEVVNRILELPETADFMTPDELRDALDVYVAGEHPRGWE